MVIFWLAYSCLFLITTIVSLINAKLHRDLTLLKDWINDTHRPALMKASRINEARDLRLKRIPLIEEWDGATTWYSLIVFGLQMFLLLLGGFVGSAVGVPYIMLMIIVLLFASLVFFFPRTLIRWLETRKAIGTYFLAHASLVKEISEKSNDVNDTNSGTNSHS